MRVQDSERSFTLPSETTIVVGFDGSPSSRRAARLAHLVGKGLDAHLRLVAVLSMEAMDPVAVAPEPMPADRERERELLRAAAEVMEDGGDWSLTAVMAPSVSAALHREAEEAHAQLLVVGSGAHRRLRGSRSERIVEHAPCAVLVAPPRYVAPARGFDTIGVAVAEGEESARAAQEAALLADALGTRLLLVTAIHHPNPANPLPAAVGESYAHRLRAARDGGEELLRRVGRAIACEAPRESVVLTGEPGQVLASEAVQAELLVIGSRGRGPMRRVLLGSVSSAVLRSSTRPVLVVPRSAAMPGSARAHRPADVVRP